VRKESKSFTFGAKYFSSNAVKISLLGRTCTTRAGKKGEQNEPEIRESGANNSDTVNVPSGQLCHHS
jgi:hypothetical protein